MLKKADVCGNMKLSISAADSRFEVMENGKNDPASQ